jgi:hypothetical protein
MDRVPTMEPPVSSSLETEHSLPVSAEELRTENAIKGNPHSGHNKRKVALIAICVTAFALIVGFGAAIAQSRSDRRNGKNKALANWNPSTTSGPIEEEDASVTANARATSRLQPVIDFLSVRISEKALFNDQQTPQYRAAKWIADQDFLEVPIPADPQNYDEDYEFVQRYIMAVLYFAMDGVNWRYKAYFMSSYEVCEWNMDFIEEVPGQDATDDWLYGVQCDEKGAITTIFMSTYLHKHLLVVAASRWFHSFLCLPNSPFSAANRKHSPFAALFTAANGLKGQLPGELGDLLDMDHLSLFSNEITGNIPDRLQYAVDMDFLNLEGNLLSGRIPTWINAWKQIEFLNLGDNQFTGPVPDLTGLDYLLELALDGNMLTGSIDVFTSIPFVESLFINNNNFTGFFGDDTWDGLDNLKTIDISSNEFITGYVPEWVYYLESVDLHDNYLNMTMPEVRDPEGSPLSFFSVYGNDLRGRIPASLGDLPELYHLDLGDNYFTGQIPDEFFYLENLEVLYVTDNMLGPQPFPDLSDSVLLTELGIGDSQLTGPIPDWIGDNLPDLAVLDLRDNDLTGSIPDNLSYLDNLQIVLLNYNQLDGEVPDFSYCKFLRTYFVSFFSLLFRVLCHASNASPLICSHTEILFIDNNGYTDQRGGQYTSACANIGGKCTRSRRWGRIYRRACSIHDRNHSRHNSSSTGRHSACANRQDKCSNRS